jgi:hypothetical protein
MTTQNNPQRMMDAFKRAQADIASLADWIECELEKYDDDGEVTWASVGSLEHVRENLIETLAFFSGVEQSEIKRSLDELHM